MALQSRPMRRYKSVQHRERGRAGKPSDKEERPGHSSGGREGGLGGEGRGVGGHKVNFFCCIKCVFFFLHCCTNRLLNCINYSFTIRLLVLEQPFPVPK